MDRLEFGVIAGGGSRSDLDPIDPNDPLASNLYKPTSVSVSPLSASSLLVSTYLPETPINGYVMKVETFGTDDPSDDTIQIVAGKLMTTELGDGGLAKDGWLLEPSSVVYLKDGGFLVYDAGNARIRRVTAGDIDHATISTIAGNGTSGLAAPGTPANIAPLADAGGTVDGLSLRPADMELTSEGLVMSQGPYGVLQMIPATAITAAPPVLTQSRSASFTLASWDDNATYACKLDGEADFTTCHSYSDLPDGSHTFQAQATTNGGGDVDPSPSTHTWTVDGTPPAAFALASPAAGATVDANPTISWNAATDATTDVARYELWFDHAKAGDVTCCSTQLTNLHDGAHTFQIRAVDSAGNVRESEERSFNVSSAPTASFTIAPTRALIGRNVTFDATKSSDSNGTIVNYAWDLDGDGSFETDTGASPTTARSYAKPQTLTIGLRVTDNDGVTGTAIGQLVVTTQPPVGQQLGVSINDGAQYTNDPGVTVFSVWPGFASDALVSNDGGFKKAVTFPVAEQIAWTLDSSGPERLPKTIYVRFTAGAQVSETYQDDIILDQTPPKVLSASLSSGGTAASAAAAKKVTLKLKAKDNVSGVGGVQVTSNKRKPGKVLKYKKSLKVKAAETLYVRVRDRAGNFSSWRKAKR